MSNLNDEEYWNFRFASGNWNKLGRIQTEEYAKANIKVLGFGAEFEGSILDFGCALGDAIPVYSAAFPKAHLIGVDISQVAVDKCKKKYGKIADFFCGNYEDVLFSDVIIASHIMEHMPDDIYIVENLLGKCKDLFVIVPYKESPLFHEHVNYYDDFYYSDFVPLRIKTFNVSYRRKFVFKELLKDLLKLRFKQKRDFSKEMILFHFKGAL